MKTDIQKFAVLKDMNEHVNGLCVRKAGAQGCISVLAASVSTRVRLDVFMCMQL